MTIQDPADLSGANRNVISDKSVELLLGAADRLSDMANSVAGFAISSSLVLIFASLKDIAPWVQTKAVWFEIGIALGTVGYCAAVFYLYEREAAAASLVPSNIMPGELDEIRRVLMLARMAGIVVFALVCALAIYGTSSAPMAKCSV